MSGFLTGGRGRLTGRRLVAVLVVGAVITAGIALLAILLGVGQGRSGRTLELLGIGALETGSLDHQILWSARVPRVLTSVLVGGALAGAGCALQALLRNPLAEPFTLGISSGSSLAAVIGIRLGIESWLGSVGVGLAALLGAVVTLLLVWQLGRVGRHLPPATLVLAGVTLSMFCSSVSQLIEHTSDFVEISRIHRWMMGSLDSTDLGEVRYAWIPIVVGLVALFASAHRLNALAAGPDVAASLGVDVPRTQVVVFSIASLLVGVSIAIAGPIGFIGLIVPHAIRAVLGPDHRLLVPASMFGGAVLLTLCDTLARTLTAPAGLPTGAITAVLGGPFFVVLLVRQKRRAAMWGRG